MKRKVLISVIMVLAIALIGTFSLAGCKDAAGPEVIVETVTETVVETVMVESDEPVKLLLWAEPYEIVAGKVGFTWDECIAQYQADTGSTTDIRVVEYPFSGLEAAVLIAIQSDTFPDMYFGSGNRIIPLIGLGVFDAIPEGTVSTDQWPEIAFKLGTFSDTQYFVAQWTSFFPLLINKALFKKAGVEDLIPDEATRSWTRDDYMAAIEAISALDDTWGTSFDLVWNDTDKGNDAYVWADGDPWTDETYVNATFNTPKNIENFEWIVSVMQSDNTYPNPLSVDVFPQAEDFIAGKIGVYCEYLSTAWEIYNGYEDGSVSKDDVDPMYVFFPTDDGGPSKSLILVNGFAIKKQDDAAKVAAAQDFYKWLYDADNYWIQKMIEIPLASLLANGAIDPADYVGKEELLALGTMPVMDGVEPLPFAAAIPGFQQLRTVWHENIQLAYLGDLTPEEARNKMQEEAQQVIDDAVAAQAEMTANIGK